MAKKICKFEDSILGQMGWTERDYIETMCDMASLKIKNNIRLTPDETKIYAENVDKYNNNKHAEYEVNCLLYGVK